MRKRDRSQYILYEAPDEMSPVMDRGETTPVVEIQAVEMVKALETPSTAVVISQTVRAEVENRPLLRKGTALCLSGGGYRAMLFHAGALWRLNELGMLRSLAQVSSVSGGSITAGMLGLAWKKLAFDRGGVARNLKDEVIEPLRGLARVTIDRPAVWVGAFLPNITAADRIEAAFRRRLYGDASLEDLPGDGEGPQFAINATNVQSGELFLFSRAEMVDARVGVNRATRHMPLARAIAASSAFPPFLSPMVIDFDPQDFTKQDGNDLHEEPYTSRVLLTDGGVYDNLALETAFMHYETILVSDAGAALEADGAPHEDWARHGFRTVELIQSQNVALRKRQLLAAYERERSGTYWGIRSDLARYMEECPELEPLPFLRKRALELAGTPTRLFALEEGHQEALIDWGYTVCDAAVRGHLRPGEPRPPRMPYHTFGEGPVEREDPQS